MENGPELGSNAWFSALNRGPQARKRPLRAALGLDQALQLLGIRGRLGHELRAHGAEGQREAERHGCGPNKCSKGLKTLRKPSKTVQKRPKKPLK